MKQYRFSVPYLVSYHNTPLFWGVEAANKTEARKKAVYELSTDSDVYQVASTRHIINLGEIKKGDIK